MILRARQGRVGDDVTHDRLQLVNLVSDLVNVDTIVVCSFCVFTVLTLIHEPLCSFVFLGVQHVVALRTELNADELGTFSRRGGLVGDSHVTKL